MKSEAVMNIPDFGHAARCTLPHLAALPPPPARLTRLVRWRVKPSCTSPHRLHPASALPGPAPPQVYHNEVTARLRERRVESDSSIEWLKVLRFYHEVRCGAPPAYLVHGNAAI